MKILGIETSCDETAICLLECSGALLTKDLEIKILGNALRSQIEYHKEFGGVVPMMAKREHAKNLIPLFMSIIKNNPPQLIPGGELEGRLENIFGREIEFKDNFIKMIKDLTSPSPTIRRWGIDAIAVTEGPGLEPALWMGIIFAEALGEVFNIPIIPVNHMEGHIMSAVVGDLTLPSPRIRRGEIQFPAISLLISGGHTELVFSKDWKDYKVIGETRDDAVGEAFDKVARMLGLPYPGGPEIAKLAQKARNIEVKLPSKEGSLTSIFKLPRPMIKSDDFDFSFSGLKTAVLYGLKEMDLSIEGTREMVAKEFEDSVTEVLVSKTMRAVEEYEAKTLIIGGGVVSNEFIRKRFEEEIDRMQEVELFIPHINLRTDNAVMIAIAGYEKFLRGFEKGEIKANGTLRLG